MPKPASWLLKTEPSEFSYEDLEKAGQARWDGVANPVASKNLRAMNKGDRVVIYHTGKERRAVGLAQVVAAGDPPEVAPAGRLENPVPLDAIKEHELFASSPLVTMGRLSVVPLDEKQWKALLALSRAKI